jgi:hypothetical protein
MPVQSNVNVTVRYAPETTFGTAAAGAGQSLRRVSSSLTLSKDAFTSNEVRADQQVFDARHGTKRVGGAISGELSLQTYDDFIEAALRGTWASGVTSTQAAFTNVAVSGSAFQIGGGSYITAGYKVGDVIRLSGFSHANVGKNFRITALTGTAATVTPTPAAMTAQTTFTIAVVGRKLLNGTQQRSFTVEQMYPDIDINELFLGCRVGDVGISVPPSGIASINIGFQGKDGSIGSGASAPFFSSPTAETSTGVLAGVNGSLSIAGVPSAVVTGLDFSITNSLNSTPVVGANTVPDIFYGRNVVSGNVSAYLEDQSLLNVFLNEQEIDLVAQLEAAGSDPKDFICFRFHRIKLNGVSKSIGPDGGVIASFPFQALLRTGGGATVFDQSTMVIQRSNA